MTWGVARGRHLSGAEVRARVAKGPFIAEEAKAAGFVDQLAFDDQVDTAVDQLLGAHVPIIDQRDTPRATGRFGAHAGIALVYVEGDMVDGRSRVVPLLGMRTAGSYTLAGARCSEPRKSSPSS
jgi:protease-4